MMSADSAEQKNIKNQNSALERNNVNSSFVYSIIKVRQYGEVSESYVLDKSDWNCTTKYNIHWLWRQEPSLSTVNRERARIKTREEII